MRSQQPRHRGEEQGDALAAALEDWRGAERTDPALSSPARSRIMMVVNDLEKARLPRASLASLFVPAWKLALGGAAPLLLVAILLGPQLVSVQPPATESGVTRVEASKVSGEVVFTIANGSSVHRVAKSNDLSKIESVEVTVVTQGAFRDRLESDANLVFYRID